MVLNFLVMHLMLGRLGGIRPARAPLLVGAAVGAVVIELLKQVMALLVGFVIDKPQYGALSAPIGIMFVLYLQSSALYLVASLTAALAEVQAGGPTRTRPTRAGLRRPLDRGKVDRPRPHASTSQRPRGRCRGGFPAPRRVCLPRAMNALRSPRMRSFPWFVVREEAATWPVVPCRHPSVPVGCRVTAADAGSAGPSPARAPPEEPPAPLDQEDESGRTNDHRRQAARGPCTGPQTTGSTSTHDRAHTARF